MKFVIKKGKTTYNCDYDEEFDYLYISISGLPSTGENILEHVVLFKKLTGVDINGFKRFIKDIDANIEEMSEGSISKTIFSKIKKKILQ